MASVEHEMIPVNSAATVRWSDDTEADWSEVASVDPTVDPTEARNRLIVQAARQAPSESLPPGEQTC